MEETVKIGSLFSGYGGLDMGTQIVFPEASPAWFVEYDDAPSRILAHHWPKVPNLGDVTTINWETLPPVDILTGGYPCQPFSTAGYRKGTNDERHLWPYIREAIRHLRPRFTFLENVAGHRTMGFDRVLGDLAEDGLHAVWCSLRASDIGAPHRRERLFILAAFPDTESPRWNYGQTQNQRAAYREINAFGNHRDSPANPDCIGCKEGQQCDRLKSENTVINTGGDLFSQYEWGEYEQEIRRWEQMTRTAPCPVEPNSKGNPRLTATFSEWMMGLPTGHVTAVPGLSRTAQIKAIGNGVCPQQAAAALQILFDMMKGDGSDS